MKQKNNKKHKHSKLIHAWADGAEIQRFDGVHWRSDKHPSWDANEEYRVRPDGAPWHPEYKDKYFIVDENFEPSEEVWDDCEFDDDQYERGNCFRTIEEAEAASKRVKAALLGGESEELKKLRKESDEQSFDIQEQEAE